MLSKNSLEGKNEYNIAVVGATGAVGMTFLRILEDRSFPVNELRLLASHRSKGKSVNFNNKSYVVEELTENSFEGIDIAFFSAGGSISKKYARYAVEAGAVVIDNSSAFRLDNDVPLIVPEVNGEMVYNHKGIIANPNCTTIIMLVALKPLYDYAKIKNVIASTYQSASGAGAMALNELLEQINAYSNNNTLEVKYFSHQLLFNVIPQIGSFLENGYTGEEMKMVNETRKIMNDSHIKVSATCVRVPVLSAHSESITVVLERDVTVDKARELFSQAKGIKLVDDTKNNEYPMPLYAAGKDDCFVGRIRKDLAFENALSFFVVGDQLRKGAALNAIQIAELLIKHKAALSV
ncbi:MAG: aspartate-semialdehyde dehydrogenase [Deferribacterota bacterium]|nr:aspartate-semialdehyde dehydrogenase [Deferribacterota bacterium]